MVFNSSENNVRTARRKTPVSSGGSNVCCCERTVHCVPIRPHFLPSLHILIIAFSVVSLIIVNNCFATALSQCSFQQFECADKTKCIPMSWKCDGDEDCADKSDEKSCAVKECARNEFRCSNGKCIPNKWQCDNEDDCGDRSDESNCSQTTCHERQFKCVSTNLCIPNEWLCDDQDDCVDGSDEYLEHCKSSLMSCHDTEFSCNNGKCLVSRWVCDGENDCGDNSDEAPHICANQTCPSDTFTCKSGKCITNRWHCDGDRDCPDGDDEFNCVGKEGTKKPVDTICGEREFLCDNGHECINMNWRCDHSFDCTDRSDEKNCSYTCRADQFRCNSGQCIPETMRCNGDKECNDDSDELFCNNQTLSAVNTSLCAANEYQCSTSLPINKCIKLAEVCNGVNDCGDWSDEPPNCEVNECLGDHRCSHTCVDDLVGYHCECRKGYRLGADNKTCDDIDECQENYGLCSGHICLNQKGHFKCQCFSGYELKDHRYCKAKDGEKPLLMFANRHDIRTLDLSQKHRHQHYNSLFSQLRSTIAVDYSLNDNYIIWSDVADEKLFIAPLDANKTSAITQHKELYYNGGIVDALAIDWIHTLVYWTDTSRDIIEVANITSPHHSRAIIIDKNLEEPRGIAVNVLESWIVWTDWGSDPKIERSLQDGSERKIIVKEDIVWPNGVTIDLITKKIYWLDAKLNTMSSIDYDGKNRRLIIHSSDYIKHPFSLDIFEDTVYWTDWELESVLSTNKFGIDNKIEALVGGVFSVMDIRVIHSYKKPNTSNRCEGTQCSHICLPTGQQSYSCACPPNMALSRDKNTCKSKIRSITVSPIASESIIGLSTNTSNTTLAISHTLSSSQSASFPSVIFTTPLSTTTESIFAKKTATDEETETTPDLPIHHHKSNTVIKESDKINSSFPKYSGDQSDGKLTLIITVIVLCISLVIGTFILFIYRKYQRRKTTSMNFDNPVYRKTTEDHFVLEKSDDSFSSYPSSMEPLTSPGTNGFV